MVSLTELLLSTMMVQIQVGIDPFGIRWHVNVCSFNRIDGQAKLC